MSCISSYSGVKYKVEQFPGITDMRFVRNVSMIRSVIKYRSNIDVCGVARQRGVNISH